MAMTIVPTVAEMEANVFPNPSVPKGKKMATPKEAKLNLSEGSRFAKDLMLVRTITRCPDWAIKAKGAVMTLGGNQVKGKHSSGTLQFDIDPKEFPIFRRLRENSNLIDQAIATYTVVDAEDGYRLVSMYKRTEFMARLSELHEQRMELAKWLDQNFDSVVVPLIQKEHPDHFSYMQERLPRAPFGPRLELAFRLRPVGALGPGEIDPQEWENLSAADRERTIAKMIEEGDKLAKARASAIINGAMQPITELALEIQGKKPNPKYDPTKPESSANLEFLPGIDSGRKRSGFLDGLMVNLQRITNFRQYMTDDVIKATDAALEVVKRANGDIGVINTDGEIQNAIKVEMAKLSGVMQAQINVADRSDRAVEF